MNTRLAVGSMAVWASAKTGAWPGVFHNTRDIRDIIDRGR